MILAVSMVVPAVPGQKVNADVDYWRDDMPDAVANYPLDSADDTDSPFYTGTVTEATIVALGMSIAENFGETFKEGDTMNYLADDYGIYAKWNPAIADAAYATTSGDLKCWTIRSVSNISQGDWATQPFNKKYIVVDLGNGDYAQLQWSDTVYTEGSTGVLNLATNQQFYHC